jgi:hypothetical protein
MDILAEEVGVDPASFGKECFGGGPYLPQDKFSMVWG